MLELKLFSVFFKIGLFSFGGGYAMLPMIFREIVERNTWIDAEQFMDILAISQVTPGPIAINSATYIGFLAADSIKGSLVATLGVSLPSVIIMVFLCKFLVFKQSRKVDYALKALRYVTLGLILTAGVQLINRESFTDWFSIVVFFVSLPALIVKKVNPILLLCLFALIGNLFYALYRF